MAGAPDISLQFLQDLVKDTHPNVVVQDFETATGSKQGDNYTSMLYRITLNGVEEVDGVTKPWKTSLIYKCLPESELRREAYKSDALFSNEIVFYNKVLPALVEFQRAHTTDRFDAIPRCFLARKDLIILEDLNAREFRMADRRLGLTTEQCRCVLEVMAHFHSMSLAMKLLQPERFQELIHDDGIREGIFIPENEEWYRHYYRQANRNALAMLDQAMVDRPDKEKYTGALRRFLSDNFFGRMVSLVSPVEPLAAVSHGDCWTNNFLFRYAQHQHTLEVQLVDFQLARYTSVALDVAYVCYLCLSRSQRRQHMAGLLRHYAERLHAHLASYPLPPHAAIADKRLLFETLKRDFRCAALFALGLSVDMLPIMTCDSDEAPDLYQAKENENITSNLVTPVWTSNELCRNKLRDLVEELVDDEIL